MLPSDGFLAWPEWLRLVLLWRFWLWCLALSNWKAGLFTLQFFFGFALTLVSAQSACWGWPCGCTAWVLRSPASKYTPQHSGVPSFRPLEIANGTLRRFRSQIAVPKGT